MRLSNSFRLGLLSIAVLLLPGSLFGQIWSADTYFGRANYETTATTVDSNTAAMSLRYNQDHRIFQATAGAPFSSSDVTWGVLEFDDRFAAHRGALTTGADVALLAHGHRDPLADVTGKGVLGEVLPMISHNVGAGVLEFRSGVRWYGARLGDTDWTRALWSTDVRGSIEPSARFRLVAEVRHDRAKQGENYTRPGVSVATSLRRLTIRASVGDWINNPNNAGAEWGLSIGVPLTSRLWLVSGARHDTFDPTFLISPRTSWGAGLSFQVSRPAVQPAAASIGERTDVVLRVPLRESGAAPSIAGDFTNWEPVRMTRYDHEWRYTAKLGRGVYHFALRNEQGEWFIPDSFPNRTNDGMGGRVAVLVVP